MNLKNIRLSEKTQAQRSTYYMIPFKQSSRTGNMMTEMKSGWLPLSGRTDQKRPRKIKQLSEVMEMFHLLVEVRGAKVHTEFKLKI